MAVGNGCDDADSPPYRNSEASCTEFRVNRTIFR
jgi:hypothetical protein